MKGGRGQTSPQERKNVLKTGILDKKLERNSSNIENQTRNRSDQGEADDPGNQATVPQPSDLARACFLPAASSLIGELWTSRWTFTCERLATFLLRAACLLGASPADGHSLCHDGSLDEDPSSRRRFQR